MASKLIRCPEGHIYDADAHEACPDCGAMGAAPEPEPVEEPIPSPEPQVSAPPPPAQAAQDGDGASSLLKVGLSLGAIGLVAFLVWPDSPQTDGGKPTEDGRKTEAADGIGYFGHSWQTMLPGPSGGIVCTNHVQADGAYRLEGCSQIFDGETGQFWVEPNGAWRAQADTGRFDQGIMKLLDEKHMSISGMAGTAVWTRVD